MDPNQRHLPGLAILALGLALLGPGASAAGKGSHLSRANKLAMELAATLSQPCDPSLFESSVDFERLVMRGIDDVEAPEEIKRQFTVGARRGFDLASGICRDIEQGATYNLLRVRMVDGQPRVLFRLIGTDGVNYHDFLLDGGKQPRIVDIYVYSNGEWLSQLIRRGFLPLASQLEKGNLTRIGEGENLYLENLQGILEMIRHYREGNYAEAMAVFEQLPPELHKNRNVLMQRFAVAIKLGGEKYDQALLDLKTAFPDDPSLGLVLIDYHFNRKEFDTSLEIIDRLDADLGGDPYLDFLRANVHFGAGRVEAARRAAHRAIDAEPSLEDPYWTLVTISLEQKEFAETAQMLSRIETDLGLTLTDLERIPEYAEFVDSEEYRVWIAGRDF